MWKLDEGALEILIVVALFAALFIGLLSLKLKSEAVPEIAVKRIERSLLVAIYIAGLIIGGIAVVYTAREPGGWGFVLVALPYVLIMQHAMFLRIVRQPVLTPYKPSTKPSTQKRSIDPDSDTDWWRSVLETARGATDRYFGPVSLAIRYGTSAMAVLLVGLVAFMVLFSDGTTRIVAQDHMVRAAQLGVAGAYVYVLAYLGKRNFTHDVTSGGAMWCGISLAIGPVLASALFYFWHGNDIPAGSGGSGQSSSGSLGADVVYFMAGLSPRYVISFVEDIVKKAWSSSAGAAAATPRSLPLTQVAGITPEIVERLAEEGIFDVHGLAMADPLRLIRNTNYDRRVIVSWIDEAMLIAVLPEHWQALEKEGITGAVDLVSLVYPPPYREYQAEDDLTSEVARKTYLGVLCRRLKMSEQLDDDQETLKSIARRLVNDAQLRMIWVLHNHIADESVTPETGHGVAPVAHA